jgi:hypothetical protein
VRIAIIKLLSSLLLLFIPILTGLFGTIICQIFRLPDRITDRIIVLSIVAGTPSPVLLNGGLSLQPALMLLLKFLNGFDISYLNLVSAILCMGLLGGMTIFIRRWRH